MSTTLNEVVVHLVESVDEATLQALAQGLRRDRGVVSVGHRPGQRHLMVVVSDSAVARASSRPRKCAGSRNISAAATPAARSTAPSRRAAMSFERPMGQLEVLGTRFNRTPTVRVKTSSGTPSARFKATSRSQTFLIPEIRQALTSPMCRTWYQGETTGKCWSGQSEP